MRLTEATVALRPRTPWEAIDLGVSLARKHRRLLMSSWAITTLPVFVLLSVVFHDRPYLAALIIWWLKPLFERLPLLILSQALFGAAPTLKQALRAWPASLKTQLLPSLLWRRLSLSRSFLLPVQQLEKLSGPQRALRVDALSRKDLHAARLLTLVGCHLEVALLLGLSVLLYALIPQQLDTEWIWRSMLAPAGAANWLDHLNNLLYGVLLIIWEPVYVACGFTLYLNRRTVLEAWDIELVFRRLRQRLIGSAYAWLVVVALVLAPVAPPTWADARSFSCPLPDDSAQAQESAEGPDTPRLTRQTLTSQAAQQSIKEVLQQPPFRNLEQVSGWRFREQQRASGAIAGTSESSALNHWLRWLTESADTAARGLEVGLWAIVLGLAGLLVWRYRAWFGAFVPRRTRSPRPLLDTPAQLFGLRVGAETLPADVAASAERLWASQPREALGLLYRALLSRLLADHHLPLKNADTEGEVLERIAALNQPALAEYSRDLMRHWQNLAYGQRPPPAASRRELCDGWRRLFGDGAPR